MTERLGASGEIENVERARDVMRERMNGLHECMGVEATTDR